MYPFDEGREWTVVVVLVVVVFEERKTNNKFFFWYFNEMQCKIDIVMWIVLKSEY